MKDKISGKIFDGGLCLCDVCGKKSKLGGFLNPMSPDPQVACCDCMIRMSAEEKGISIAAAEKQRNDALRVSGLFTDCKMKEYLESAKNKDFKDIEEANKILQYVMNVWNTFDINEKDKMAMQKDDALIARFENVKMNWNCLMDKPRQKRNDPCACGSGRKYKVCCLVSEEQEKTEIEKWKRFDTWVIRKGMILMDESKDIDFSSLFEFYYGKERLADAKKYGVSEQDMEEFNEWFMNDYFAPDESTPYVLGKLLKQNHLSEAERKIVEARMEAPKSVYLVTFIKRGTGALLRNMFDQTEVFVHDNMMSKSAQPGCAVFLRVFPAGPYYLISGGHLSYPPMYLDEKIQEILKAYKKSRQKDGVNHFLRRNGHIFGRLL
ncbi:MAG TPA: SEC-C metal-binding domain-containing protein [Smithellaceae bacterium]|nr:SEC-C metal-binding domain-containing protein [Smithellaceae bacterium]HRV45921.1 SEC-C metal-binding domain-containing protein [Smithellaceae bacterium]